MHLIYHGWAADPLVKEGKVCGAAFESKAGRRAIKARLITGSSTGIGAAAATAFAQFGAVVTAHANTSIDKAGKLVRPSARKAAGPTS